MLVVDRCSTLTMSSVEASDTDFVKLQVSLALGQRGNLLLADNSGSSQNRPLLERVLENSVDDDTASDGCTVHVSV